LSNIIKTRRYSPRKALVTLVNVTACLCEAWSLNLREEYGMTEFENWVLRTMFGPKADYITAERRISILSSVIICTVHQTLLE
jgi:hypothetical protein